MREVTDKYLSRDSWRCHEDTVGDIMKIVMEFV